MARFRMHDGTIVETDNVQKRWEEKTRWNGNNHIGIASGSQWNHQELYKSRRGRYFIVYTSQWQGSVDRAELVSPEEAACWLLSMEYELPEDLQQFDETIVD